MLVPCTDGIDVLWGAVADTALWFALARLVEGPSPGTAPEKGTLALLSLGLLGLGFTAWRRLH